METEDSRMGSRQDQMAIVRAETAMVDDLIDYFMKGDKCVPPECILIEEHHGEPWVRVQWYEC